MAAGGALATTGDSSLMLPALGAGSAVAALLGAHATASIGECNVVSGAHGGGGGVALNGGERRVFFRTFCYLGMRMLVITVHAKPC